MNLDGFAFGKLSDMAQKFEDFPVLYGYCELCITRLAIFRNTPNPRIAVGKTTRQLFHEACFNDVLERLRGSVDDFSGVPERLLEGLCDPVDDPEEADRLIQEHRVKILERMKIS